MVVISFWNFEITFFSIQTLQPRWTCYLRRGYVSIPNGISGRLMSECDAILGTLRGLLEGGARAEASRQSRSSVQSVVFAVLEQVHKD